MEEKAKYIVDKEVTLFNDLKKAYKKFEQIANWYSFSNYECNSVDKKNRMLYVQLVNNIYSALKTLLSTTRDLKLYENLKDVVTGYKLEDLSELEKRIIDIKKEEKDEVKEEYNLNFDQAIKLCLNNNSFVVGKDFKKGCYLANNDSTVVIMEIQKTGFQHKLISNLPITKGVLQQKFKTLVVVNQKTLGME